MQSTEAKVQSGSADATGPLPMVRDMVEYAHLLGLFVSNMHREKAFRPTRAFPGKRLLSKLRVLSRLEPVEVVRVKTYVYSFEYTSLKYIDSYYGRAIVVSSPFLTSTITEVREAEVKVYSYRDSLYIVSGGVVDTVPPTSLQGWILLHTARQRSSIAGETVDLFKPLTEPFIKLMEEKARGSRVFGSAMVYRVGNVAIKALSLPYVEPFTTAIDLISLMGASDYSWVKPESKDHLSYSRVYVVVEIPEGLLVNPRPDLLRSLIPQQFEAHLRQALKTVMNAAASMYVYEESIGE